MQRPDDRLYENYVATDDDEEPPKPDFDNF